MPYIVDRCDGWTSLRRDPGDHVPSTVHGGVATHGTAEREAAQMKRTAPDPEFVLMYRKGISSSKIAAMEGVAESTVRYHLQIASRAEPSLRDEHKAALPAAVRRPQDKGLRNLADVIAFHESEGMLPVAHGKTSRERALGTWLMRRRREAAQGRLSPLYYEALAVFPGWDKTSTRKADDEVRWQQRLEELRVLRAGGGDWPRHQKTDDPSERTLGVWLHGQRIDYRAGKLARTKERKLNKALPGWKEGRGHRAAAAPQGTGWTQQPAPTAAGKRVYCSVSTRPRTRLLFPAMTSAIQTLICDGLSEG